jgi:tape measure domain-containing protein
MATSSDQINIIISAVNQASAVLSQVEGDLKKLSDTASKSMSSIEKSSESLMSSLRNVGLTLSTAVTAPLTLLGKAMVSQVGQLEQYKIAFDTMLGSVEKGSFLLKQISDFAMKTPFTLQSVAEGTKQLLAYGYSLQEIIPNLRMLGDVAAGVGAPIQDIIYLQGTLKAQGQAYMMDIRQLANRGIPIYKELARVFGVNVSAVRDLVTDGKVGFAEVQKAFINMTSEGGLYYNLMKKQSESLNGIISNIKDSFLRVSAAILGVTLESGKLNTVIKGGAFDQLKNVATSIMNAMSALAEAFSKLSPSTKAMIINLTLLAAALGPIALLIWGINVALGALLTPLGLVSLAIVGIVAGFVILKKVFEDYINSQTNFNQEQLDTLNAGFAERRALLEEAYKVELDIATKHYTELNNEIATAVDNAKAKEGKALDDKLQKAKESYLKTIEENKNKNNLVSSDDNETHSILLDKATKYYAEALKEHGDGMEAIENKVREGYQGQLSAADEELKNILERQIQADRDIELEQIKSAEKQGGIYDAKNKVILLGWNALWFQMKNGFLKWSEIILTSVIKWGNDMISKGTAIVNGIISAFQKGWAKIKEGWDNLRAGKIVEAGISFSEGISPEKLLSNIIVEANDSMESAVSENLAHYQTAIEDINKRYSTKTGDYFNMDEELAKSLKNIKDSISSVNTELDKEPTGGDSASDKANKLEKQVKELGQTLEDYGVFAIKAGDKVVATFKDARGGVDAAKKAIEDLNKSHETFGNDVIEIENKIGKSLDEEYTKREKSLDSYDSVNEKLKEVSKNVDTIISKHQKWLDDAKKGLEDYDTSLLKINEDYKKIARELQESSAEELVNGYVDAEEKRAEAIEKVQEAQEDLDKLLSSGTAEGDSIADATKKVADLTAELDKINKYQADFNNLKNTTTDFATQLEAVKKQLENTTLSEEERTRLIREQYTLMGKQQLMGEALADVDSEMADFKAEQQLSEIDFIAYKLGKELEATEIKKQAEIKALEDMKKVNEAIMAGTIDIEALKAGGVTSEEALLKAQQAQQDLVDYQSKLEAQKLLLEQYKNEEVTIYSNTRLQLEEQQAIYESYLTASIDRLIKKYQELAAAAISAKNAGASTPSATPIAPYSSGGFTPIGNISDIAGVVHKGEWVAPNWMIKKFGDLFKNLEGVRTNRGFSGGGYTSPTYNQTFNMNNNINDMLDFNAIMKNAAWIMRSM